MKSSSFGNNHLAYGEFEQFVFEKDPSSGFGKLVVPEGMRPVSDFRKTNRPLITMPFGPPQPWLMKGHEGAASTMASQFGKNLDALKGHKVNQSGYLSLWNAQPRSLAPSWNPLLMQGGNMYVQSPSGPTLSDVVPVSNFGRRRSVRKVKKVTKKRKSSKKAKAVKKTKAVKKAKKTKRKA